MELGFSVAAGPLSQISVSLFSVELAVQLATGAYGWWKVRDRTQSLARLVGSKGAQISATSTFNLLRYVDRRQDSLLRGVARNPDGILSCVTLPNASTASAGDAGMVCMRAVVCALLCFYSTPTVLEILISALPGTLYTSNQEGGNENIEGPLLSALRDYIKAAAIEEDNDGLRQRLQDTVDSKLLNITGATRKDVFECDYFLESDAPNLIGALRWILTPEIKRKQQVYPTRSLKVWAFAVIMAQLGFEVAAAMQAISSKADYEIYIEKVGYQSTYQEVFLVTSNDVPTDPLTFGDQKIPISLMPRIGSIRSIPWIAFRHLNDSKTLASTEFLSEVWEFTFEYVLGLLGPPPKIRFHTGFRANLLFTQAALDSFKDKRSYEPSVQRPSLNLQWLTFVITEPLQKFLPSDSDIDSIWDRTNSRGQFRARYLDIPEGSESDDWYITRTATLATIYAVCCKWLQPSDSMANLLDTEVAFCPDFIRRGDISTWTSFSCFGHRLFAERMPSTFKVEWEFGTSMEHSSWFHLLYLVFSGTAKDPEIQHRLPSTFGQSNSHLNRIILGFQKNGVVLLPGFLLHPEADPEAWFKYHLRVGQVLDLPLDEDGFICHSNKPEVTKAVNVYGANTTTSVENQPSDIAIRLDAEPWWEVDEKTVVFRARVGGVVKAIFSPQALYDKNIGFQKPQCQCPTPTTMRVELRNPVVVLRVSEFLSRFKNKTGYNLDMINQYTRFPIFVQTGGDRIARIVCLAVSPFESSHSPEGCLDAFKGHIFSDLYLL